MKRPFAILLGSVFLTVAPLQAFIHTNMFVSDEYRQTGPAELEHFSTGIFSTVVVNSFDGTLDSVDEVALFAPDDTAVPTSFVSISDGNYFAVFAGAYPSRCDIPRGEYAMQFTGGSLDGLERVYEVENLLPRSLPQLSKRSYRALSSAPVSRPIRLLFRPFKLPKAASTAQTHLFISGPDGAEVYTQVGMDPRTASVTIPANTLVAGAPYFLTIIQEVSGQSLSEEPFPAPIYQCINSVPFIASSRPVKGLSRDEVDEEEATFIASGAE